jgi:hypothetical protein
MPPISLHVLTLLQTVVASVGDKVAMTVVVIGSGVLLGRTAPVVLRARSERARGVRGHSAVARERARGVRGRSGVARRRDPLAGAGEPGERSGREELLVATSTRAGSASAAPRTPVGAAGDTWSAASAVGPVLGRWKAPMPERLGPE